MGDNTDFFVGWGTLSLINHTNVPDADARSGRFVNITRGPSSLGEVGTNFAIQTSVDQPDLEIRIFDGDTGRTWDPLAATHRDRPGILHPLCGPGRHREHEPGRPDSPVERRHHAQRRLVQRNAAPGSRACEAGKCRYNLDVAWQGTILANVQNNFKLDVKGQLALLAGSSYGFIGYGPNDPDTTKFPATTFDGVFTFWPFLAAPSPFLDVWTGDFDRADDTDDANSPAFPPFTYPAVTVAEAARPGSPADDAPVGSPLRISPSIYQEITDIDRKLDGDRHQSLRRQGVGAVPGGGEPGRQRGCGGAASGRRPLQVADQGYRWAQHLVHPSQE